MAAGCVYRSLISDSARWDGFEFRPGDIIISTPAKCGTTWMQMICALLVFQTHDASDRRSTCISPWLDMLTRERDDVVADLDAQTHRRFIKTHTPFDGLPYDDRVTYICVGRDPRDVALLVGQPHGQHGLRRADRRPRATRSGSTTSPS